MKAIKERSQAIGEFLDWASSKGMILAKYDDAFHDESLRAVPDSIQKILARYFGIDLNKIETEKLDMIEELRKTTQDESRPRK